MATRLVTHAARNSDGDIVAIGNPEEPWYQRRREWAISDILADRHVYFASGRRGRRRRIDVINSPSGPYLRTRADRTEGNNLDNLPALDVRPWEIALDDAEVLAVHAALVPHGVQGQVLLLGGDEHDSANADSGEIHNTRIYDVDRNVVIDLDSPEADVFCCGHAFLAGGRLLVGGGTESWRHTEDRHFDAHANPQRHWSGARECAVYDLNGTWTAAASLLPEPGHPERGGGRWYPTLLTLGDGRILALGGHPLADEDADGRHGAWLPESYDPAEDVWTYQPGHWLYVTWGDVGPTDSADLMPGEELVVLPDGQEPVSANNYLYYPRLFAVPDGRVFMASPNDGACGWYDPATGLVDEPPVEPPPHGGRFDETNHTAVLLPLLPADDYAPHVLFLGLQEAHRLSLNAAEPGEAPAWQPTAPRDWPAAAPLRRHGCATLLPTGDVLFTGGIDDDGDPGLPDTDGVLEAELYHAGFDWDAGVIDFALESWTTNPRASVVRNYHSVALLLPNGRVLTAGSNIDGRSGDDDVKEYRIEVFCPAYDADTNRPVISQAPAAVSYGQTFQVVTSRASRIQRVALMRCGSVTHAWDGDQRYVGLDWENPAPGVIQATAAPSGHVAPPGAYMLWVVDDADRPCRLAPFVLLS
jgi:hypothetical protein